MDSADILEQHVPHMVPHDGSIILRQNAYADMRPFIEHLWETRREMCCNIYLDQFPRGTADRGATREEEDAFLLGYFSQRDLHLQGGRFLKQVLYAIAKFNEDSVLSHAEKWWREYNFCSASGMYATQIRQVLDFNQRGNFPDSFLCRVVLLISDGFRRLHSPQDQLPSAAAASNMQSTPPVRQRVASVPSMHEGQAFATPVPTNQQRHRSGSIHGNSLLHGNGQPYSNRPRQFHKQEHRARARRPSASNFPDFDPNIPFIDPQSYAPVGPPMRPDGTFNGYYQHQYFAHLEPRVPPGLDYSGPVYHPDGGIAHQRSGSFGRRGGRPPRLVDPHSFDRFAETQSRPYPPYSQRGGHRSSFNSTRGRRPSFRSADAWQGPRDTRLFERRVRSDHHDNGSAQARESRSSSDLAGDSTENHSHPDTRVATESDEHGYTNPALPSLSEDGSVDTEVGQQQDSSPKTVEDDSFQTAAETPTATPTEKASRETEQSAPHSPTTPMDHNKNALVDTNLSEVITEDKLLSKNAETVPQSPTTSTTESGDTESIATVGQRLAVPKSGPKQTESFSPFARRPNTKKKEPKQKPGKSKNKQKSEQPKQPMADTPVEVEATSEENIARNCEAAAGVDGHVAEDRTEESENNESLPPQANVEENRTGSSTPQRRSTLSSVAAAVTSVINSMSSSNKSKSGDDLVSALSQLDITQPGPSQPDTSQPDTSQLDISQPETSQPETSQPENSQPEVVPSASKNKSKNKNKKKKKKAKAAIPVPDDTSTETIANDTPVGSPSSNNAGPSNRAGLSNSAGPSTNSAPLSVNMLDNRLSILNIGKDSIVELHENMINYHTSRPFQKENLSLSEGHNEEVEKSRRKMEEMDAKERMLKQKK